MRRLLVVLLVMVGGACGGGPSVPGGGDDDVPPGFGTVSFDWRIEADGLGASCGQVGASQVEIINNGPSGEVVNRFSCVTMGNGTSDPLAPGTYSTLISLLDAFDSSVQTLPGTISTVLEGNDQNIGLFVFSFGTACDAASCGGCCNGNTCVDVQSDTQCGIGGVPCDNCSNIGLVCDTVDGFCVN